MNYYIQGDAAKAEQIKAAFEELGYDTKHYTFDNDNLLFYTINGDYIPFLDGRIMREAILISIIKTHPDYKELELPVEPCFKAGDKIEATIYGIKRRVTIREVDKTNRCYFGTLEECIGFSEQDQWHLAPKPHYDIANFYAGMPVLVRADNDCSWDYSVFSRITGNECWPFAVCNGVSFTQCIPFNEETKHLLGTTDMCDEQYINW